ncbi:Histone-lysine N-methyltransferase set9 [Podila clonocystis]|nr:Histone-lysine N-methyltransferase set9 [Podila clonocystis]
MDLQTLSSLDDLLSDVLLDGVNLWFQTHKMSQDYQPLCLPRKTILQIIQKRVIIDRRVSDAVKELLEINAIAERLNNERLLQNFQVYVHITENLSGSKFCIEIKLGFVIDIYLARHARRYLNVYLPSAGFEISQTDRYSALTNKSEACVIATRVFEAGHELRFCAGSIANLTIQEERDLEKKTSDFSVIRTSRRGTCLFLGPARFVNHDCDPNCNFMPVGADVICFKALKPIEVNEEITTYYGDNYFGVGNQECLCATCERAHEYEGCSSWLHIGSRQLALGCGNASESCGPNSPTPMELSSLMDSTTDTSGSNLSTPPYTDSNSDVDIDSDEKGDDKSNRDNTNLLQSVSSRMSIAFLCHDSSPSPRPSPGLITPEQSNPHVSTCSVDAPEDRGHRSSSQECRKRKKAQRSSFEGNSSSTEPSHSLATKGSRIEGVINDEASSTISIQHS